MKGKTWLILIILLGIWSSSMVYGDYCYQESANESTACGGKDTGGYRTDSGIWIYMNNTNDGNYDSYGYAWDGGGDAGFAIEYVDYFFPSSTINDVKFQIKAAGVFVNETVPAGCLDEKNLSFRITADTRDSFCSSLGMSGSGCTVVACYDTVGNSYNQLVFNYSDVDEKIGSSLYEEAVFWNLSGPTLDIVFPSLNETQQSSNIDVNYTVGDTVDSCWWTNNSGTNNYTLAGCDNITGQNWMPINESINTVTVYANDTEGEENSKSITFYIDTFIPTVEYTGATLADSIKTLNDWIYVKTNYTDFTSQIVCNISLYNISLGLNASSKQSSPLVEPPVLTSDTCEVNWTSIPDGNYSYNVTVDDYAGNRNTTETRLIIVGNNLPTVSGVDINDTSPTSNDDLNCTYSSVSDIDGETVTISYEWYNDTTPQGINNSVLGSGNTTDNDNWKCSIIPWDGYENGTEVFSGIVSIGSGFITPSILNSNATTNNSDIISNATFPTNNNSFLNLSVEFSDANSENWTAYFCSTDSASVNGCAATTYCMSEVNISDKTLSCLYNISNLAESQYTYYSFVVDNNSLVSSSSSGTFDVNHPPGIPSFDYPINSSVNYTLINFTVLDTDSDAVNFTIYNSSDNINWDLLATNVNDFNWTDLVDGRYYLKAQSIDEHGYSSYLNSSVYDFYIDRVPPNIIEMTVSSTSVTTAVSVNAFIRATDLNYIETNWCTLQLRKSDYNGGNGINKSFNISTSSRDGVEYFIEGLSMSIYGTGILELEKGYCRDVSNNVGEYTANINISISAEQETSGGGGGPSRIPDVQSEVQLALNQSIICGNGVCQDGESPVSCSADCSIGINEILCPLTDIQNCPTWAFSFMVYLVLGLIGYGTYRSQTKK